VALGFLFFVLADDFFPPGRHVETELVFSHVETNLVFPDVERFPISSTSNTFRFAVGKLVRRGDTTTSPTNRWTSFATTSNELLSFDLQTTQPKTSFTKRCLAWTWCPWPLRVPGGGALFPPRESRAGREQRRVTTPGIGRRQRDD
jgi:hypothetical protein